MAHIAEFGPLRLTWAKHAKNFPRESSTFPTSMCREMFLKRNSRLSYLRVCLSLFRTSETLFMRIIRKPTRELRVFALRAFLDNLLPFFGVR